MAKSAPKTAIAIGKHKGHQRTALKPIMKKDTPVVRPSRTKGVLAKRTKFIRALVEEISGSTPYERRAFELLKAGTEKDSKKAVKVLKQAVGTNQRAKVKKEKMLVVIRAMKKK